MIEILMCVLIAWFFWGLVLTFVSMGTLPQTETEFETFSIDDILRSPKLTLSGRIFVGVSIFPVFVFRFLFWHFVREEKQHDN